MSSRPSRSSSIPIPPRPASSVSPARHIESVLSFTSPISRARPQSHGISHSGRSIPDEHRGLGISHGVRGTVTSAPHGSPIRPTARSFTHSGGLPLRPASQTHSPVEPRVIRADSSRGTNDAACLPTVSPSSSSRTRRTSTPGVRAPSTQRTVSAPTVPNQAIPIPRPSYLEHSALRHMLQTELPTPALPSTRKQETDALSHTPSSRRPHLTDSEDERSVSPPAKRKTSAPTPPTDEILKLPTRWCDEFRHHLLTLSPDGRELAYHGATCNGDRDAAAARTIHPVPPACGIFYYEVEIRSKGQKAHISIGFSARDVKLSRLPGWEPNSWGYHGDDGCSFAAEKNGTPYGPTYGLADTIGCGIDFTTHRAFFTKNGTLIAPVFDNVGKDVDLYPSIGLQHSGDSVVVNFGHEPFKYDIEFHVQQQRSQAWAKILETPILSRVLQRHSGENEGAMSVLSKQLRPAEASEQDVKKSIHHLVLSYLAHHGYLKSAKAFRQEGNPGDDLASSLSAINDQDVEMDGIPNSSKTFFEQDIERRTGVVHSVIAGDIDTALQETRRLYPSVLEADAGLMLFKLRCRKFVELILEAAEMKRQMQAPKVDADIVEEDNMDVDDEHPGSPFRANGSTSMSLPMRAGARRPAASPSRHTEASRAATAQYEHALHEAITYGQSLQADYKSDSRPEVRSIFKRTFGIVAWHNPLEAGGQAAEVAGQDARVELANELNQAILKSQGKQVQPALERLYRHTAVCIQQLGILGHGIAAFADVQKELLE